MRYMKAFPPPKQIWMYWHNGIADAPPLVRICIESWQRRNPGWTVQVLEDASLSEWVDMQDVRKRNPRLTIQAFSDVLRWRLLAQYGGVWADATLYCSRPLDDWLPSRLSEKGFFCFRSPEDFLYHSWFLVGEPSNSTVKAMNSELERFFITYGGYIYYWNLRFIWRFFHFIEQKSGRYNQELWRSWAFRRILKVTPYFIVMYLMGAAIARAPEAERDFKSVTTDFGEAPHAIQLLTKDGHALSLDTVRKLLESDCPVQKLTLKRNVKEWTNSGMLDLLDRFGRDA